MKDELRRRAKVARTSLPVDERRVADAVICEKVTALPAFREAETVFTYLSFGAEVETRGIIEAAWGAGKAVTLPRCVGPCAMRWFQVDGSEGLDGLERLELSPFGMREPRVDPSADIAPAECPNAVAIVPGLLFDGEGYRLGYGGGYYDPFLAAFAGTAIGVCRSGQLSRDPLPREPHDRPVDVVVTE